MASWADWYVEASRIGFPLGDFLNIDVARDQQRLCSSGLPFLKRKFIDGASLKKSEVVEFCEGNQANWARVYHKSGRGPRFYELDLNTTGMLKFLESLKINYSEFKVQLFEFYENKYGGNILSDDGGTFVEVAEGNQDIVGKCLSPFFHGKVTETGTLKFLEENAPRNLRIAARNALNFLKLSRGEYQPGYYEFLVSPRNQIYFLDYKTKFLEEKKVLLSD